eukprot:CAMPEP_0118813284 /NCGR_PEP_ID=MMETSP1162-20130426/2827_1 /TAXON_ID=33656 /ORGANISM="Phaeocystis Sp, Strain CCMP2710" /LENGTH=98 /DNA_ID=CAMNT_0006743057 /DNA_START=78 /DNA_END=371 /DNA_ORIENTATION=+
MRILLSHGDPGSDVDRKIGMYKRIARAVEKINKEDRQQGAAGRRGAIWLADHNMVKDRKLDEERGTRWSEAKHRQLVEALEAAEACLSGEGSMRDGYR